MRQKYTAEEDVSGAIGFLRAKARGDDIVWVHASCAEAYKLYESMARGRPLPAAIGNTGWPCCPRGRLAARGSGNEERVRADLQRAVPSQFAGHVWLLYTLRPSHWRYIGLDEYVVVESALRERGCATIKTPSFSNVGLSKFHCP